MFYIRLESSGNIIGSLTKKIKALSMQHLKEFAADSILIYIEWNNHSIFLPPVYVNSLSEIVECFFSCLCEPREDTKL